MRPDKDMKLQISMSTRLAQNGKVCLAFRYVPCYAEVKLQCLSIYFKSTYICYRSSCISNKPTPGGKSGYFQCMLPNCPHSLNNDLQVNLMLWVTHATYVRIQFSFFLDSQYFSFSHNYFWNFSLVGGHL